MSKPELSIEQWQQRFHVKLLTEIIVAVHAFYPKLQAITTPSLARQVAEIKLRLAEMVYIAERELSHLSDDVKKYHNPQVPLERLYSAMLTNFEVLKQLNFLTFARIASSLNDLHPAALSRIISMNPQMAAQHHNLTGVTPETRSVKEYLLQEVDIVRPGLWGYTDIADHASVMFSSRGNSCNYTYLCDDEPRMQKICGVQRRLDELKPTPPVTSQYKATQNGGAASQQRQASTARPRVVVS